MINQAILIGRLGKDPELKYTPNGNAVAKFSVATTEKYDGKEKTTWHNIIVWGKQAEGCSKYLTKGSLVYLEGKIDNRTYDDKNGVTKYISEVIASRVQFLDNKKVYSDDPKLEEEKTPAVTDDWN